MRTTVTRSVGRRSTSLYGKPQISPLRFAPVEMTKAGVVADQAFLNPIFIPLGGPQAHEHSVEMTKLQGGCGKAGCWRPAPVLVGVAVSTQRTCFPHGFAWWLCELWVSWGRFRFFPPVLPLFIFLLPGFRKPGRCSNPRSARFLTCFPLFQRQRLLLLAKNRLIKDRSSSRRQPRREEEKCTRIKPQIPVRLRRAWCRVSPTNRTDEGEPTRCLARELSRRERWHREREPWK